MTPAGVPASSGPGLGRMLMRDTALYGVGHVAARSTYLILVPVLTRALDTSELGAVDLLTAASAIALSLVTLEVTQGLARYVSAEEDEEERRRLASSALWYGAGALLAFALIALLAGEGLSTLILGPGGDAGIVRAAALAAAANGLFLILHGQLRWELRAAHYAAGAVILAFASLAGTILLVTVLDAGPAGVFYGQLAGSVVAGVVVAMWVRSSFALVFSPAALRRILRFSVPLAPAAIAAFAAANADRFVISRVLGNDEVGVYGVGYRMASIIGLAVAAFQLALTPLIYARYQRASTPAELARVFGGYAAVAIILWLAISLFAPELVALLATGAYAEASTVVPFLAGALIIAGMASFAPGLAIAGRTEYLAIISTATLLAVIGLNVLLVPSFGIVGAAASGLAASTLGFALTTALGQRHYRVPYPWLAVILLAVLAIAAQWVGSALDVQPAIHVVLRLLLVCGVIVGTWALRLLPTLGALRVGIRDGAQQ